MTLVWTNPHASRQTLEGGVACLPIQVIWMGLCFPGGVYCNSFLCCGPYCPQPYEDRQRAVDSEEGDNGEFKGSFASTQLALAFCSR